MTTAGQILVNEILPPKYRNYSRTMGAKELESLLAEISKDDPDAYSEVSSRLMRLGNKAAYESGTTLRLSDISPTFDRSIVLNSANAMEERIRLNPKLSEEKKRELIEDLYDQTNDLIKQQTYETATAIRNPFAMQVKSKARGNQDQLAAMISTPGIYQDSRGKTVPMFIQHSFAEGLTPAEYWAGSFGARLGVVSSKFCLDENTEIQMADGTSRKIRDIKVGDLVAGNDKSGRAFPSRVVAVYDNGIEDVNRYWFSVNKSGKRVYVDATDAHKLLATRKQSHPFRYTEPDTVPLSRATVHTNKHNNTYVAKTTRGLKIEHGEHHDGALLLGLMIGDGCASHSTKGHMSFSCADHLLIDDVSDYLRDLGFEFNHSYKYNYYLRKVGGRNAKETCTHMHVKKWILSHIDGKKSHNKELPHDILRWDDKSCLDLIAGYLATDGSVEKSVTGKWSISFSSTSTRLLTQLDELLVSRFGILSGGISKHECRHHDKYNHRSQYSISIKHPEALRRFSALVTNVPGIKKTYMEALKNHISNANDVYGCRIDEIQYLGKRHVYDIEVDNEDHLFTLANGIISSNSTRKGGYLGKLLSSASIDQVVTEDDCGGAYGLPVKADDSDNIGCVLQKDVAGHKAGDVITKDVLSDIIKSGAEEIIVRSPTTCASKEGVCSRCCGIRETGGFPPIGYNLGLNAASALSERIAQGALNMKHSGKRAKGKSSYSGFEAIKNMTTVPGTYPDAAVLSPIDGKVTKIESAPQGGTYVHVGDQKQYVSPGYDILVKDGDDLEAGDQISDGVINPADVVQYKGIGEGRRYFTERFTQMMHDSNYGVNRRNVEAVAKSLVNHVQIDDEDSEAQMLPGDVVTYSRWSFGYRPRPDTGISSPKQAIGKYLESPVLHYTIGTKISRKTASDMEKRGIESVFSNPNPIGVTPMMQSIVKSTGSSDDWMARLGTTYLKTRLTEDVQHGAESHIHGTNPIPGIAKGVEFGNYFEPGVHRDGGYSY